MTDHKTERVDGECSSRQPLTAAEVYARPSSVTSTQVSHVPTPWTSEISGALANVRAANGVAVVFGLGQLEAAFIVRACNSHAALVEALKECSFRLATLVAASGDFSDINASALDKAQAALALAEAASHE